MKKYTLTPDSLMMQDDWGRIYVYPFKSMKKQELIDRWLEVTANKYKLVSNTEVNDNRW